MKTIAACALLAALAFGLLPGKDWNLESEDDGLVLLVETDALQEAARAVSGAADAPEPSLDSRTVRLLVGQDVLKLSMEDYLTGVLLSEMPVDFSPEARKAQVVAARTFTCRKLESPKHTQADVCADFACCQAWTSRGDLERKYGDDFTAVWQSAQELVRESAGEVLTFGGELIDAVYFPAARRKRQSQSGERTCRICSRSRVPAKKSRPGFLRKRFSHPRNFPRFCALKIRMCI